MVSKQRPEALIGTQGEHKFSVRVGFGMYFNRDAEEGQLQNLGDTPTSSTPLEQRTLAAARASSTPLPM